MRAMIDEQITFIHYLYKQAWFIFIFTDLHSSVTMIGIHKTSFKIIKKFIDLNPQLVGKEATSLIQFTSPSPNSKTPLSPNTKSSKSLTFFSA